jgi:hypothetical protein
MGPIRESTLQKVAIRGMAASVAVLLAGSAAEAQPALDTRLRQGDKVSVFGPDIGKVGGRLIRLTPDMLTVDTEAGERAIPFDQVDRITRTRFGVLLGPIIGAGAGAAFSIPVAMLFHSEGASAARPTATLVALGAGIGLAVDAALNLPRTVYRRDQRPRVTLAPQVGRDGGGVAVHVTF